MSTAPSGCGAVKVGRERQQEAEAAMVAQTAALVAQLGSNDLPTRVRSMRSIRNAIIGNKSKKAVFLKAGALPAVLELLQWEADSELLIQSATTLGSLTYGHPCGLEGLLKAAGLPRLVRQLFSEDPKVVEAAIRALKLVYSQVCRMCGRPWDCMCLCYGPHVPSLWDECTARASAARCMYCTCLCYGVHATACHCMPLHVSLLWGAWTACASAVGYTGMCLRRTLHASHIMPRLWQAWNAEVCMLLWLTGGHIWCGMGGMVVMWGACRVAHA